MILDTTVLVDLLRHHEPARERVEALEERGDLLWIPVPAVFELFEGIEHADRPEDERSQVEEVLDSYTLLEFASHHAQRAGTVSGRLIRRGRMLDPIDVQIAGMALAERQPVLTRDLDDFERVTDLEVETY